MITEDMNNNESIPEIDGDEALLSTQKKIIEMPVLNPIITPKPFKLKVLSVNREMKRQGNIYALPVINEINQVEMNNRTLDMIEEKDFINDNRTLNVEENRLSSKKLLQPIGKKLINIIIKRGQVKINEKIKGYNISESSIKNAGYNELSSSVLMASNHKKQLSPIEKKKEFKYTYSIFPGNNGALIEKCMKTRPQWERIDKALSSFAYFIWSPLSKDIDFSRTSKVTQYVNHLEYHSQISNKMTLFGNMMKECENSNINLFEFFPFTISLQITHYSYREQLNSFKKLYENITYFINNDNQTNKYFDMFNVNLSKKIGSVQKINIPQTHYNSRNLWLIKPVNLNRGRFITIESDLNEIIKEINRIKEQKKLLNEKKRSTSKVEYIILQKYIERPLLYQQRKFDIRMWVLFNNTCEVSVFKEGHLKATSEPYNIDSKDPFVHLTNFSVQKYHTNFSKEEIGNEISFDDFQKELDKTTEINFRRDIYPKICQIIKLSSIAVKNRINFMNRKCCFEIFGYDFLIDEEYNPFLIEINTNPGLEYSSPLITKLTPRMIDDALRLTIDELTKDSNYGLPLPSPFPLDPYSDYENLWEKILLARD